MLRILIFGKMGLWHDLTPCVKRLYGVVEIIETLHGQKALSFSFHGVVLPLVFVVPNTANIGGNIPGTPSRWGINVKKSTGPPWMGRYPMYARIPLSSCRSFWFPDIISPSRKPVENGPVDLWFQVPGTLKQTWFEFIIWKQVERNQTKTPNARRRNYVMFPQCDWERYLVSKNCRDNRQKHICSSPVNFWLVKWYRFWWQIGAGSTWSSIRENGIV